ncbi:MAG: hypothetical protein JWN49_107 [Parcubacteria group bacterium]|nr:hypothetical protein [Parcubacteria group bacterium]
MQKKIIVIGGGMAGTSAAYFLTKKGYDVTIIEKNDRLGGRIHTQLTDGISLELGAGFMTNMYPNVLQFLRENNLLERLYRYNGLPGIIRNGKIRISTPKAFLGTKILSWSAKFHILPILAKTLIRWNTIDIHNPWKLARYDNASITDLYSTPSGKEFLEYVLQPALHAHFYWAPEDVSEAILLIAGKTLFKGGTYKLRGGLQRMPEKAAEGATVLLNKTVTRVQRETDSTYSVTITDGTTEQIFHADGIVCATTASAIPQMIPDLPPQQRTFFEGVQYSSTTVVARTYNKKYLRGNIGIAFPRKEDLPVSAVTALHEPDVEHIESSIGSLKVSAAGTIGKELCLQNDNAIIKTLVDAAQLGEDAILIDKPAPLSTYVQRWEEALPIFDTGYFKKLESFNEDQKHSSEALVFAGDYLGGPFMEGAFTSGLQAAQKLDLLLSTQANHSS